MSGAIDNTLLSAFTTLVTAADPERAEHALRVAIKALVDVPRVRLGTVRRWSAAQISSVGSSNSDDITVALFACKNGPPNGGSRDRAALPRKNFAACDSNHSPGG